MADDAQIEEIVIRREGHRWTVIRRREESGEALGCDNLEDCFDAVRAAYDKHGKSLPWPKPRPLLEGLPERLADLASGKRKYRRRKLNDGGIAIELTEQPGKAQEGSDNG